MALFRGSIFVLADPIDAAHLEEAIEHAFLYRREHNKRIYPDDPLFLLQSQLHSVATEATTVDRHAKQPATTPTPPRREASPTMGVMEASEILGITTQAVTKACRERRLHAVKVRGSWRITRFPVESLSKARSKSA